MKKNVLGLMALLLLAGGVLQAAPVGNVDVLIGNLLFSPTDFNKSSFRLTLTLMDWTGWQNTPGHFGNPFPFYGFDGVNPAPLGLANIRFDVTFSSGPNLVDWAPVASGTSYLGPNEKVFEEPDDWWLNKNDGHTPGRTVTSLTLKAVLLPATSWYLNFGGPSNMLFIPDALADGNLFSITLTNPVLGDAADLVVTGIIPEPSTMFLGGIGIAALLLRRRRNVRSSL